MTALAWEFWGRNRWAALAFGAYIAVCAAVAAVDPGANPERFASLGSIWFVMGLCYLLVMFTHGAEVRLETADSGFPTRFFLLPVRTSVLVGWPMFQGVLAVVLVWMTWDQFVLRPCGIETPFWWSVMLAAVVAATQALLWVPFGLPWIRLPVTIVVLTGLVRAPDFLSLAGERFTDPGTESALLTAIAVCVIPTAFLLARFGVGCARRGDSPDWFGRIQAPRRTGEPERERPPFSSPLRALVWYEWRLRGRGFPLLILFTIAVLMACGLILEQDDGRRTSFGVTFLFVPVVFAGFCGSFMGATGDSLKALFVMPTFAATRPVSNSAFVLAKLLAAALVALVTWGVVVMLMFGWFSYTGGVGELPSLWERAVAHFGSTRAIALGVLLAVGPVLVIWRLLVENLWVGLTGRVWVGQVSAIVVTAIMLLAMYEWTTWTADPARKERALAALRWAAGGAVVLKFLLAGWGLRVLRRRGELGPGAVLRLLGVWCVLTAVLVGVLCWLCVPDLLSVSELATIVVLFVPLARLVIAPLALGWNRHR
jgi:hypothetical protein